MLSYAAARAVLYRHKVPLYDAFVHQSWDDIGFYGDDAIKRHGALGWRKDKQGHMRSSTYSDHKGTTAGLGDKSFDEGNPFQVGVWCLTTSLISDILDDGRQAATIMCTAFNIHEAATTRIRCRMVQEHSDSH
ncbi:predicted protein [Lichtheimia corymbifera JMRC:FSU:9682]|uniref:Uncharacterized protein n=1 Tax=Lichtheimia corymbifera JMRC:FSU:9682 TaxID=1263082 RepID=A0A068SAR9_9FUNG|nr:predicted protein [Lichtheimia corymbifera JMRC:FSU:9682]